MIPSLALPISIVGTFAVMYLLDYSLDNLSLMALTLSVGFVVDDAIVMLENIVRHMEMGKPPMQAALDGAARDRLHDPLDDALAHRRVHPDPVHGRHRRPAVPRVRGRRSRSAILVSGFVSLTLTPMLSSRFLRPHGTTRQHGRALHGHRARLRAGCCGQYEATLDWAMRHRRADDGRSRSRSSSAPVVLFMLVPKGFIPERGHRADLRRRPRPRRARRSTTWSRTSRQVAAIVAQDPNVARLHVGVGRRQRRSTGTEPGPHVHRPQAARPARLGVDDIITELRAEAARRCRASSCTCRTRRRSRSAAARRRASISSRCRAPTSPTLYPAAQQLDRRSEAARRVLAGRRRATCSSATRRRASRSTASAPRALGVTARADRDGAVQRVRLAPGLDDLHAEQRVLGDHGARCRSTSTTCRRSTLLYVRVERPARSCRSSAVATITQTRGPAHGEPLRTAAVRDDLVQPAAGRLARRRRRPTCSRSRAQTSAGGDHDRRSPARRRRSRSTQAGLLALLVHRDLRDLHRARHPVRELHPSDHDSLRPAVRGVRRAAHAADLQRSTSASTRSSASSCSSAS